MTFEVDGATVGTLLFENGGRLSYPGRKDIEYELKQAEPYTLDHEARVLEGLSKSLAASIRLLAFEATYRFCGHDSTLDLLWVSHNAYQTENKEHIALDRLVAALVSVQALQNGEWNHIKDAKILFEAAEVMILEMHRVGLPPTIDGLDELFDGAPPASVGLCLIDL